MQAKKIVLAAILSIATAGARAQVSSPRTIHSQMVAGNTTAQTETYSAGGMPYSSQTDYNGMGNIPPYKSESPNPSYMGVLGEKWETDKRGRRSTFIHNGQEMSVGYDTRTDAPNRSPLLLRPNLTSSSLDSLTRKIIAPSQTTLVPKRSN